MNNLDRISTDPRPLRDLYFDLGQALFARGRVPESVQSFEQALKEDGTPGRDMVLFDLGRAYEKAGDQENAFQRYLEAVSAAPQRTAEILPYAHKLLTRSLAGKQGEWLEKQWQPTLVTTSLQPAIQGELASFLGRVSLYRGDYARAEQLFRNANVNSPNNSQVLEGLGEVLCHTGKVSEGLQLLTEAQRIARDTGNKERLVSVDAKLAHALMAAGQYQAALGQIQDSLAESDQFTDELLLSRGQCHLALAEWDKALEAAAAAQERAPGSIEARIITAQALIARSQYSDAEKVVDEALQYDLQSSDLLLYKAEALLEGQSDLGQGRRLLARYVERAGVAAVTPDTLPASLIARKANGNAQYFLAELYRALGRDDDALQAVNLALQLNLSGEGNYREAPAQQLKAELCEKRQELQDAATYFYEAGRRFVWRNDFESGAELLRHSLELDKNRPETYWYRAEALRMLSYQPTLTPEEKKKSIAESAAVWDRSIAYGYPDRTTSWAYVVRSLINEERANIEAVNVSQQRARWWESAAFVERALLLNERDAYSWACLGRVHRFLGDDSNALQATKKAWDIDNENVTVQEERAAILANVGDLDASAEAIDKRRAVSTYPWVDSVKAFIFLEKRQYKDALDLLIPVLEAEPSGLWYLDLRARCYRMLGDPAKALEDYKTLWSRYNPQSVGDQIFFGVAAYHVGEFEQSARILSDYLSMDDDTTGSWYLGAAQLAQGNLGEGEKNLSASIASAKRIRELDDLLADEVPSLKARFGGRPQQAAVAQILQRVVQKVAERRTQLQTSLSPVEELVRALEHPARADGPNGSRATAVYAGLGRLYIEAQQYGDAAKSYQQLRKISDKIPEVVYGAQQVAKGLQLEGDQLLGPGDFTGALRKYQSTSEILADAISEGMEGHHTLQADAHARIGYVRLKLGDHAEAKKQFETALNQYPANDSGTPGEKLGGCLRSLIFNFQQFWELHDALNTFGDEISSDRKLRASLEAYLNTLDPPVSWEGVLFINTPIVLDLSDVLVPFVDPDQDAGNFIYKLIPAMHERIKADIGVNVPGVRARPNAALPAGAYEVQIDEVPVNRGSVLLGHRYFAGPPDSLVGIDLKGQSIAAVDPVTGDTGLWLDSLDQEQLDAAHKATWSEPEFIAAQVETVLRRSLSRFVGVQESAAILGGWAEDPSGKAMVDTVLPTPIARWRFSWLLRALLAERVPIKDWRAVLAIPPDTDVSSAQLADLIRGARLRLRSALPGNQPGAVRLPIPADLEEKLLATAKNGKAGLAADPSQKLSLLFWLRGEMDRQGPQTVLVTRLPALRPLLRRLIAPEFPDLMVVAQEELVAEPTASGSAESSQAIHG